ncbi:VanZ family protein [Hydrogenophaga sp. MI9]|uniref:VanZ family protein n=1 Tax=Hydrogenophaga sp. MI9 TaxID=3453719 RepID=UPI003EEB2775
MPFQSPIASRSAFVAFWAACATVGVLSLTPVDRLPPQIFDIWDKAQHAAGFAGLAFLGRLAYPRRMPGLLAGLLLYGALIEVAQAATGWRHGDVNDWLADAVGVLMGTAMFHVLFPMTQRQEGDAQ